MGEHPHITLVRKGYESFATGDMEGLTRLIAADAVHHVGGDNILSNDYKGIDAILGHYGQLFQESGGTLSVEVEHFFTDGHGRVVTVHRSRATRDGKEYDQRGYLVFDIVDDKVVALSQGEADIEAFDRFWA
jgi:ketosteroid isomerase-like protein